MVYKIQKKKIIDEHVSCNVATEQAIEIKHDRWAEFVTHMQAFEDVVLVTMFQGAQFLKFDESSGIVSIAFLKKFSLFVDLVEKEKSRWVIILQKVFGHQAILHYSFDLIVDQSQQVERQKIVPQVRQVRSAPTGVQQIATAGKLDLSDANTWKFTHELMKHFDGTIIEISGDLYE